MLIGMKCKVGNKVNHSENGFKSYDAVIASEPQMEQNSTDFYILVLCEGKLIRVDTDYMYEVEPC